MADASAFKFVIPKDCGPTVNVPAPDGVLLKIPVPENVLPGDELYMAKGPEGQWGISKAVRLVNAPGAASAVQQPRWRSGEAMAADCARPDAFKVRLDTTKGAIFLKVVAAWSPLGVQRFLQMVDEGYYNDIAVYRAIRGGLLQFGVVKDTDARSSRYARIADDKLVGIPYAEGVISFAAAGPGTRKCTVCIMKADFRTQLGKGEIGTPSTETPFGMVCPESMAVMHSITCLGDIPQCGGCGPDPGKLEALGNEYIRSQFPTCDFVLAACRVRS